VLHMLFLESTSSNITCWTSAQVVTMWIPAHCDIDDFHSHFKHRTPFFIVRLKTKAVVSPPSYKVRCHARCLFHLA